ncbi:MAG: LamG-like jellyroll fold domain-containing protein [bacterium]
MKIYDQALTAEEIRRNHSGLVAYWRMDEGGGATVADSTGNGNNGAVLYGYNANGPTWVDGKCGTAVQCDGDDYVNCGNSIPLKLDGRSFSISMWTKFADMSRAMGLVGKTGGYALNKALVIALLNSSQLRFGFYANDLIAPGPFAIGPWYHLVFTYDAVSRERSVYINGQQAAKDIANGSLQGTDGAPLEIGRNYMRNNEALKGTIDEVKVFDRALAAEEIWNEYSGLVLLYTFDEGHAKEALDSSINRLHGSIVGAVAAQGKIGKALSFDGSDDYLQALAPADLKAPGPINGPGSITVRAQGSPYYIGRFRVGWWSYITVWNWPRMELRIDGQVVRTWEVNSTSWMDYTWSGSVPATLSDRQIDIVYYNDMFDNSYDGMSLSVDYVKSGDNIMQAEDSRVTYDQGNPSDGIDVIPGREWMYRNGALRFKTSRDWIKRDTTPFTLSFWMNYNAASSPMRVIEIGDRTLPNGTLSLTVQPSSSCLNFGVSGQPGASTENVLAAGQWTHVATVFSSTSTKVYINGTKRGELNYAAGTRFLAPRDILIGQKIGTEANFKGLIDEVKIYNRALSTSELAQDYEDRGLAACWRFDEGTGATAADSSGNGNNGTLINMPAGWTDGKAGKAVILAGQNQYVTVGDRPALDLTKALSLEAWVYYTGYPSVDYAPIISKEGPNGRCAYSLGVSGGKMSVALGSDGLGWGMGNVSYGNVKASVWNHLAMTWDGNVWRCYQNGSEVGAGLYGSPLPDSGAPLQIGRNSEYANRYFVGKVDEVKVYKRALAAQEIKETFEKTVSPDCAATAQQISLIPASLQSCEYLDNGGFHVAGGSSCGSTWGEGREYTYSFNLQKAALNASLSIEYADASAGNGIEIYVDDVFKGAFLSRYTGGWGVYLWSELFATGYLSPGTHTLKLKVIMAGNFGVNLRTLKITAP